VGISAGWPVWASMGQAKGHESADLLAVVVSVVYVERERMATGARCWRVGWRKVVARGADLG